MTAALSGWWTRASGALICAIGLAGCKGIPAPGELQARHQQADVAAQYRPAGQRPALPPLTQESGLSNFIYYAMLNDPRIEAAYYDWAASIERITTARSLPDPQLTFQMDLQKVVTSVMPGLVMNFPAPGKLRAGGEVASAESQSRYFVFQASILEDAFAVKRAYYQLYYLDERIRVNRQSLNLVSDLERLARAQNEVGKVTLQDVLRAQIEEDRLRTEVTNLEDSRGVLLAQWKAALGMHAEEPAPPVPQRFESTPFAMSPEQLQAVVLSSNAQLRAVQAQVRAAEAAIALAEKARRPDWSAGLMADVQMNPVLYRPVATMSLPIWRDKIAAQIAEAQDNKKAVEARLSADEIALAVAVAERLYTYREISRNLALLREQLLPKQRQSLEVARSGYVAGQIDFFNLTDAEQTWLRFGLNEVEAQTQLELTLAELSLLAEGMNPVSLTAGAGMPSGSAAAFQRPKNGTGSMSPMN
jgi:outer membrane protein TolC